MLVLLVAAVKYWQLKRAFSHGPPAWFVLSMCPLLDTDKTFDFSYNDFTYDDNAYNDNSYNANTVDNTCKDIKNNWLTYYWFYF